MGYTMCYRFFLHFSDTYAYTCLDLPRRTHQKSLSVDASGKETRVQDRPTFPCLLLYCLSYFLLCVCISVFSFLFKKKCRLIWFQIPARSLIAGQLLLFSDLLSSEKGRVIISALQGCGGLIRQRRHWAPHHVWLLVRAWF